MKDFLLCLFLIALFIWGCNSNEDTIIGSDIKKSQQFLRPTIPVSEIGVQIGDKKWMRKNLSVTRYQNGDVIPQVTNLTQWQNLTTGAWCYYNNDPANGLIYGKLYNWYAITDPRGLAPIGWHVPSNQEYWDLSGFLGEAVAGVKLKEAGTSHWEEGSNIATNSSYFTALPGGYKEFNVTTNFIGVTNWTRFWTTTADGQPLFAYCFDLSSQSDAPYHYSVKKNGGAYVRCIKN